MIVFESIEDCQQPGEIMSDIIDWRDRTGAATEKFFKTTLWQGEILMVGLNCLEPNQIQNVHAHEDADKVYFVLEGRGQFTIGNLVAEATTGMMVLARAGVPHGVTNTGSERLSLLVAMSQATK
jgi:mannose-6-phosphate isomerase-like protein (cupin superfamily)